jgi:hypothetical protein
MPPMELQSAPAKALPSLDHVRVGLEPPLRPKTPVWVLLLAALFAAAAGISVATVMIFGPGDGQAPIVRNVSLAP